MTLPAATRCLRAVANAPFPGGSGMDETVSEPEELQLESTGSRLRRAREAAGLSREDIAAQTKIAERHLISIEEDRFEDLPGKTYAIGFSRTYARAVGVDEDAVADSVRDELAAGDFHEERRHAETFEPGDPARVPGGGLAWIAAIAGLVVIALIYVFWRSFLSPAGELPGPEAEDVVVVESAAASDAPDDFAAAAASQPVVFTALEPNIWVKFYDANGDQLMQKQMAQGESYTVPADAEGPQIWTARPDALQITVGGRRVPRLADGPVTIKDRPVTASALLAREDSAPAAGDTAPATTPSQAPAQEARPSPSPSPSPAARKAPSPAPKAPSSPRPKAAAEAAQQPSPRTTSIPVVQPIPGADDEDSTDSE